MCILKSYTTLKQESTRWWAALAYYQLDKYGSTNKLKITDDVNKKIQNLLDNINQQIDNKLHPNV